MESASPEILNFLQKSFEKKSAEAKELHSKIDHIDAQLEQSFANLGSNEKYLLHSVLIHDGKAKTGHYYAFVKDHQQNHWLRMDDESVSIVPFETVISEAQGKGRKILLAKFETNKTKQNKQTTQT